MASHTMDASRNVPLFDDFLPINAAPSDDPLLYLFDDDPSLRSFPIDNGLFDDDRQPELWRSSQPETEAFQYPELPLNVLLGRTVDDCFRGFPSPSLQPFDLSSSSSSDSSPSLTPLPEVHDPAFDAVLERFTQKVRIQSPTNTPKSPSPLHHDSSTPESTLGGNSATQTKTGPSEAPTKTSSASPEERRVASNKGVNRNKTAVTLESRRPAVGSAAVSAEDQLDLHPCEDALTPQVNGKLRLKSNRRVIKTSDDESTDSSVVASRRPRSAKRSISYNEGDDEYVDKGAEKPERSHKRSRTGVKRYPCPESWCKMTFTRPNDVIRHLKNASIHINSSSQLDERARCSKCGENLSRADARKRHELKGSCGKRTIRKRGTPPPASA